MSSKNKNSKKRKAPKTGYCLFFDEMKDQYVERTGAQYIGPDQLAIIKEQTQSQWDKMSQDRKRTYEMRAEELRTKKQKQTSLGDPCVEQMTKALEEGEKKKRMYSETEQMVQNLFQLGEEYVIREKFYLLQINCYCRTESLGIVVPCEIGLLEYTIGDGGTRTYHRFLRFREIPSGYATSSKEVAEKTHKIPLPIEREAVAKLPKLTPPLTKKQRETLRPEQVCPVAFNASEVYVNILQFLLGKEIKIDPTFDPAQHKLEISQIPLFTSLHEYEITKECLGAIVADSKDMVAVPLRVYPLDHLLYLLTNQSADWAIAKLRAEKKRFHRGSPELTEEEEKIFARFPAGKEAGESYVNKDLFDHAPEVACIFHDEIDDIKFCSRSIVKRWSYQISDMVCQNLRVPMIPGKHCQKHAKLGITRQIGFGNPPQEQKRGKQMVHQPRTKKVSSTWVQPKYARSEEDEYIPVNSAPSVSSVEGERPNNRGEKSRGQHPPSTATINMQQQSYKGTGNRHQPPSNVEEPPRDVKIRSYGAAVRAPANLPQNSSNVSAPPGFSQSSHMASVGRGAAARVVSNDELPRGVGSTAITGDWTIPTKSTLAMQDRGENQFQSSLPSSRGSLAMELGTTPTNSSVKSVLPTLFMEGENQYAANSSRPSSAMSLCAPSRASSSMSLANTGRTSSTSVVPFSIDPPRSRLEPCATTVRRQETPLEPQFFVDRNNEPVDIRGDEHPMNNLVNDVLPAGANVGNIGRAAVQDQHPNFPMSARGKPDTPPPPYIQLGESHRYKSRSQLSSSPHGSHQSYRQHHHERSVSGSENSPRRRRLSSRRHRRDRSTSSKERSHRHSSRSGSRRHRRSESGTEDRHCETEYRRHRHSSRGGSRRSRGHHRDYSSESSTDNSPTRLSSRHGSSHPQERPRYRRSESEEVVSGQYQDFQSAFDSTGNSRASLSVSPHAGHTNPQSCSLAKCQEDGEIVGEVSRRSPSPMVVFDSRYAGPVENQTTSRKVRKQQHDVDIKPNILFGAANSTEHTTSSVVPAGLANYGAVPEANMPNVPMSYIEIQHVVAYLNASQANVMHPLASLQAPPPPPASLQYPPHPAPLASLQQQLNMPFGNMQFPPTPPLENHNHFNNFLPRYAAPNGFPLHNVEKGPFHNVPHIAAAPPNVQEFQQPNNPPPVLAAEPEEMDLTDFLQLYKKLKKEPPVEPEGYSKDFIVVEVDQ